MLFHEEQVYPVLDLPDGVEVTQLMRADGRSIYFVLNYTDAPQTVPLPEGAFTSLLAKKDVKGQVEIGAKDVAVLLMHDYGV
ncbi:MAG: Beta-galactosidase C-terminal domain [Chloroflexota bacterium]|nr:Beta-galactosidase C-terminal domain [Chloroflexota bacterium]